VGCREAGDDGGWARNEGTAAERLGQSDRGFGREAKRHHASASATAIKRGCVMRGAAVVRGATHILRHGHSAGHHGGMPQGERGENDNRRAGL